MAQGKDYTIEPNVERSDGTELMKFYIKDIECSTKGMIITTGSGYLRIPRKNQTSITYGESSVHEYSLSSSAILDEELLAQARSCSNKKYAAELKSKWANKSFHLDVGSRERIGEDSGSPSYMYDGDIDFGSPGVSQPECGDDAAGLAHNGNENGGQSENPCYYRSIRDVEMKKRNLRSGGQH